MVPSGKLKTSKELCKESLICVLNAMIFLKLLRVLSGHLLEAVL